MSIKSRTQNKPRKYNKKTKKSKLKKNKTLRSYSFLRRGGSSDLTPSYPVNKIASLDNTNLSSRIIGGKYKMHNKKPVHPSTQHGGGNPFHSAGIQLSNPLTTFFDPYKSMNIIAGNVSQSNASPYIQPAFGFNSHNQPKI